jgi:hypothetical protein
VLRRGARNPSHAQESCEEPCTNSDWNRQLSFPASSDSLDLQDVRQVGQPSRKNVKRNSRGRFQQRSRGASETRSTTERFCGQARSDVFFNLRSDLQCLTPRDRIWKKSFGLFQREELDRADTKSFSCPHEIDGFLGALT